MARKHYIYWNIGQEPPEETPANCEFLDPVDGEWYPSDIASDIWGLNDTVQLRRWEVGEEFLKGYISAMHDHVRNGVCPRLPGADPDTEEIADYRKFIRSLIKDDTNKTISNREPNNAKVLCEEFFHTAERSIYIFCDENHHLFCNQDVKRALSSAAARRVKVDTARSQCDDLLSFFVVDGKRWRIEPDVTKEGAIANANDPKIGKSLLKFFQDATRQFFLEHDSQRQANQGEKPS